MPHQTLEKFGYPAGLVAETDRWAVLLRPKQPTLGSLVLVNKSDAHAFGALGTDDFAELQRVTHDLEAMLKTVFAYDRINYLMLMMVDPHVHFHILPRYAESRTHAGEEHADPFWPGPAEIGSALDLSQADWQALQARLKAAWPA